MRDLGTATAENNRVRVGRRETRTVSRPGRGPREIPAWWLLTAISLLAVIAGCMTLVARTEVRDGLAARRFDLGHDVGARLVL